MILKDRTHCRISVLEIILFCGIFLMSDSCESAERDETCQLNNVLFVSAKPIISGTWNFPTDVCKVNKGRKLCFSIHNNKKQSDCCNDPEFNCNFKLHHRGNSYYLNVSEEILSMQDIVLMKIPDDTFRYTPSECKESVSLLDIHRWLNKDVKNIRLSQSFCGKENLTVENEKVHCGSPGQEPHLDPNMAMYDNDTKPEVAHNIEKNVSSLLEETTNCSTVDYGQCGSYKPPGQVFCPDPNIENDNDTATKLEAAHNIVKNVSSLLEGMTSCSTAAIKTNQIRGIVFKLPSRKHTDIIVGITTTTISILEDNTDSKTGLSLWVKLSREASEMAVRGNHSFVGLFLLPGVPTGVPGLSFLNNEVVEIEMGAKISNLSETIDIHFRNVDKKGNVASCRSWDGKGEEPVWIKDGCLTKETNDSITCQCSHLTFFGVLMSPPPGNISSADLTSLTYITSIGCGLSMFFLAAAIFMHCLIRKRKASQATEILMNLFAAMFSLNLSFLVNDKIAATGNVGACVAIAAFLHYTMLATLTWFFLEALHLCFNMWTLPSEIKHYMLKICIAGWGTPAVVVIPLLAAGKYDYLVISADDGTSANMCWIPDAAIHQGINVGYYATVFIFTFSIFILTVRRLRQVKTQAIRSNLFSVLGLLLLLGITWAFAFFSHGPLLIPSFYIFTILNSFQGFFLFIYYHNSSKVVGESSSSTASNTVVTSLYQ